MGLFKRGSTWWARTQKGGRDLRTSLETPDRRVAVERQKVWLERLAGSDWGRIERVHFAEAVKAFLMEHCATLKPSSARRYAVSLKQLADHLDGVAIADIDRQRLSAFEVARRAAGASAPTVRRDLACLSSLLTFAEDRDWLKEGANPVPGYLRRRARRGLTEAPPRTRYLTPDEEARLLAAATGGVRECMIAAIDTGLREQELFGLSWADVDVDRRLIRVRAERAKTGRERHVPISDRLLAILQAWRVTPSIHVFTLGRLQWRRAWQAPTARIGTLNKALHAAARRAGIEDLRWHDLRRTAGCRWLQRDRLRMEAVASLLGHSSIAVTERSYAFLHSQDVAQQQMKETA